MYLFLLLFDIFPWGLVIMFVTCFALKNSDHLNEWERIAAAPLRRASSFHRFFFELGRSSALSCIFCHAGGNDRRLASPDQQSEGRMYFWQVAPREGITPLKRSYEPSALNSVFFPHWRETWFGQKRWRLRSSTGPTCLFHIYSVSSQRIGPYINPELWLKPHMIYWYGESWYLTKTSLKSQSVLLTFTLNMWNEQQIKLKCVWSVVILLCFIEFGFERNHLLFCYCKCCFGLSESAALFSTVCEAAL